MLRSLTAFLLLTAGAPAAADVQPLAAIEAAVRDYVAAELGPEADTTFTIGRLDPRLRLARCDVPLATRFAHARRLRGPASVEVRCEGEKPWSLYVGVTLERYAEVVVAARPLPRDHLIAANDLTLARRALGDGRADYLTDPALAVGRITARALAVDQIVGNGALRRQQLVRRGDTVVITSAGAAIAVHMQGEALADGGAGERIRVRNASSGRVVEGVVDARGVVVVTTGALLHPSMGAQAALR
jgi:flagella basal body P-ring formation protein FlgA